MKREKKEKKEMEMEVKQNLCGTQSGSDPLMRRLSYVQETFVGV